MLSKDISRATEMLFSERKDFIIIGLTGRTGSGCTTVAKLLSQTFEELSPPNPKYNDFNNNEERKYQIVYNFAKQQWKNFKIIALRNIITSFLLEHNFEQFAGFLRQLVGNEKYGLLIRVLETEIKDYFDDHHSRRVKIQEDLKQTEASLDNEELYNFYFTDIPLFTQKLIETLDRIEAGLFTFLYQKIGNNVRTSGKPFESEFNPQNIFRLSQRTNKLIKVLRKQNLKKKGRVLVVIDALRNPYEATFFKDRYSAFYLFSVHTDDEIRIKRLVNKGFNIGEICALDNQEYPEKQLGINKFASQNIQKCTELADIHLYNPTIGTTDFSFLKKQLVKYISLIMHPGLVTPTHIERCMQIANIAKLNSGCLSRQVGAVATDKDFAIKSVGWNTTPEGQTPCNLRNLCSLLKNDDSEAFSSFELDNDEYSKFLSSKLAGKVDESILNGRILSYCFKDSYNAFDDHKKQLPTRSKNQVHTRSLHAEENAFLQLAKYGGDGIKGGILFTTASPCELCSKKSYQLGIKTIYYIDPYPGISADHILKCGKQQPQMKLFYGAKGEAFMKLYTPIIPYKDELYMLLDFDF